jgi:hypothetical protein
MMGNLGGALYGPVAGMVLQRSHHNWDSVLLMGAAVYTTGVLMWLAMDPSTQIDQPEAPQIHPWIPFAVVGILAAGLLYFIVSDSGGAAGSLLPMFEWLGAGAVAGGVFGLWVRGAVKE